MFVFLYARCSRAHLPASETAVQFRIRTGEETTWPKTSLRADAHVPSPMLGRLRPKFMYCSNRRVFTTP